MRKNILLIIIILFVTVKTFSQQRYFDEVFSNVTITSSVVYGENYSVLLGNPQLQSLQMDIYEPTGDTLIARPLVIYMHGGNFLPTSIGDPFGDRNDSSAVEICKRLARRGFVAASIDYRLGWNPISTSLDIRIGSFLQAIYRGLQDAKSCVRYFRMDAAIQGNAFRIDTGCIVVGGDEAGGYVSTAYAALNHQVELSLSKFISAITDLSYYLATGQSYVQSSIWGDIDGFGGSPALNNENWPGYSSKVCMVFNLEGALCDSTWMEMGEVPMVSFHDVNCPASPYTNGWALNPTTPFLWVTGSHDMIRLANILGNNAPFNITWTDPYSIRADLLNDGWEGLFPIVQPVPANASGQTTPWDWWDSASVGTTAYLAGLITNPDMSKAKAMKYIDTIMGYLTPRIAQTCELPGFVGLNEVSSFDNELNLFPNPTEKIIHLELEDPSMHMISVKIFDVTGREIFIKESVRENEIEISCDQFGAGLFLLQVRTEQGIVIRKLMIE